MATIKLKDESTKTFSIDGVCYTKGDYRLQYNAKKEVLIIPKAVANISNLSGLPFKTPTAWTYFVDLNDDPYNSFEEFSLAISDAINFNLGGATPQYKFLLSQSGGDDPQTATSGTLTQGVTYEIVAFESGDDFIPSGAPNNDVGTKWIANNVAPTWSNGSEIGWNGGAPLITNDVTPNGVGKVWFEFISNGSHYLKSDALFDIKTTVKSVLNLGGEYGLVELPNVYTTYIDESTIQIDTVVVISGAGETRGGILYNTYFELTLNQ